MNKPLIRWTIGPAEPEGFAVLKHSVELMRNLYPEADLMVCYNQLASWQLSRLAKLKVELYNTERDDYSLSVRPVEGYNVHRKLYPPRLRYDAHEIIIDNDIVLFKRVREIDAFLNDNKVLIGQGLNRLFGRYDPVIPLGIRVNSGIIGLPPYFNFGLKLENKISLFKDRIWTNRFDEQGLVAATLIDEGQYYMVPLTTVVLLEPTWDYKIMTNQFTAGYHFAGVNYNELHLGWVEYKATHVESTSIKFF